ncbi:MAG: AbrB/MazE/SpoVT family DNA-binding domain-containing protein [Clostridia bacterium]|nr:AbrB/MazE/SpoVT family DNA-binding domain-containing protein [Clostridia bacterium]
MKATGIVRRIDELGRVVIPKEIRRTLHFREGDPLEIFTDKDGGVVLKKYSLMGDIEEHAREFAESMHRTLGHTTIITDKDSVVAASGQGKKEFIGKNISKEMQKRIDLRRGVLTDKQGKESPIPITEYDSNQYASQCILPILGGGDVLGAVVVASNEQSLSEIAYKNAETAAYFLGSQLE